MTKAARKAPQEATEKPLGVPPGYLSSADPPRKSVLLLILSAVLLAAWLLVLGYLALAN